MSIRMNDPLFWSRNAVRALAAARIAAAHHAGQAAGGGKSGIVNPETGEVEDPIVPPVDPSDPSDPIEPVDPPVVPGDDEPSTDEPSTDEPHEQTPEEKLQKDLNENPSVTLDNSIELTHPIEVDNVVELNLNKKTLDVSQDATARGAGISAFIVKGGKLTLRNGTINGTDVGVSLEGGSLETAKNTGDGALKINAKTPIVVEAGDLTIKTGSFTSTDAENGSAIKVISNNGKNKKIEILNTSDFTGANAIYEEDAGGEKSETSFDIQNGTFKGEVNTIQKNFLTSGKYNVGQIDSSMVADGYILADRSTTYSIVPESNIVAETHDGEKFTKVELAYDYIGKCVENKTGSIKMVKDQICTASLSIDNRILPLYGATATIDFNGHKIISQVTKNGAVLIGKSGVSVSPKITFKDSVGGGGIHANSGVTPIWAQSKTQLTIEGGTYEGGGAEVVYLLNDANCTIKDGTFKTSAVASNTQDKRYIINRNDSGTGKFTLYGGTYEFDVSQSLCGAGEVEVAEGYTSKDNEDGTWTIVKQA